MRKEITILLILCTILIVGCQSKNLTDNLRPSSEIPPLCLFAPPWSACQIEAINNEKIVIIVPYGGSSDAKIEVVNASRIDGCQFVSDEKPLIQPGAVTKFTFKTISECKAISTRNKINVDILYSTKSNSAIIAHGTIASNPTS